MNSWTIDLENKDKNYLNEKELFILYWILKKKHISTLWSNVFTLDGKHVFVSEPKNPSDIATIEDDINKAIKQSTQRIHDKTGSPTILNYLLNTGKELDEESFLVYGDADYSLLEGGFLSEYSGRLMKEYLEDTEENRNDVEKYGSLSNEQRAFLENMLKDDDFDNSKFSELEHQPVKEYRDAILDKQADEDFIELVHKLVPEYDGGKWNTEDIEKFLLMFYKHNREKLKKGGFTAENFLHEDSQQKLSRLIFEYTNFGLFIKKTDKIEKYLDEYLTAFINDNLHGLSKKGLTGTFFSEGLSLQLHTQFFGFKKQRDILIKHIQEKYEEYQRDDLEIGHPYFEPEYIGNDTNDTFKISRNNKNDTINLFLFVHTMLSLEKDGYLEIEDFSYGPKQMFDLYDRGFLFTIRLKQGKEKKEIKNPSSLSFDENTRKLSFNNEEILISKKEESDPHKLMRTLFKDENKIWANDEVIDDWGYKFGEKVSENKVYQAGKKVNSIIAQDTKIKDFLDITTKSISINKKYLKP